MQSQVVVDVNGVAIDGAFNGKRGVGTKESVVAEEFGQLGGLNVYNVFVVVRASAERKSHSHSGQSKKKFFSWL